MNNLRYPDEIVLSAENEFVQRLLEENRKKRLELNSKKTEVVVVNRSKGCPQNGQHLYLLEYTLSEG